MHEIRPACTSGIADHESIPCPLVDVQSSRLFKADVPRLMQTLQDSHYQTDSHNQALMLSTVLGS